MTSTVLPIAITDFFHSSRRDHKALYHPAWLLSELDDPEWIMKGQNDLREVNGVLKGGKPLKWNKRLGGGLLTEPRYSTVLYQAKVILVWAFDGAVPKLGSSLKTISGFHGFVFRLVEFLDFRYDETFHIKGFGVLTTDDIADFLELTVEAGVCGSGCWIERWERYLALNIGEGKTHADVLEYLERVKAYNRNGRLSLIFLGAVIGVDALRLARSQYLIRYLCRYDRSYRGSAEFSMGEGSVSQLANWCMTLTQVLALAPISLSPELDDTYVLNDLLKPFRYGASGRTKSIPGHVGRLLIRQCCMWMADVSSDLQSYVEDVVRASISIKTSRPSISSFNCVVAAEQECSLPESLTSLKKFYDDSRGSDAQPYEHHFAPPFIFKIIRFHSAICFALTALFSCSRRMELIELGPDDLLEREGFLYLQIMLRKTGVDLVRLKFSKPIPDVVGQALTSLDELKRSWLRIFECNDPLLDTRYFFKLSFKGVSPLTGNDVYGPLRELSEYIGLATIDNEAWIILPHQLRRFFALSFFHDAGAENSLPALTWFMGHDNVEGTWRYIKEGLTGQEISASEAAMATSAVCSDDASEGAVKLRKVLSDYFGTNNLSLMAEEDVQEYLELLAEQKMFTATPIQIFAEGRRRISVLISIKEV
jgi:hypothetical protein